MCGSTLSTTSPSSSSTRRSTPCAAGCWGPKFRVNWRSSVSGICARGGQTRRVRPRAPTIVVSRRLSTVVAMVSDPQGLTPATASRRLCHGVRPAGSDPSPFRLLITREHVLYPFPGRLEVEGAELLRQLHRLIDHPLLRIVIADLYIAGEREVLAQRVALEAVVGQDTAQVRVAGEQDAVEIVGLPLEPVGGGEHPHRAGHRGVRVDLALDADALVPPRRQQVIDHLEAPLALGVVDAADVDQDLEQALAVVA